jgi:selenocysteine-specific elongation factor
LRRGIPREELKSRLKLPGRLFNAVLQKLVKDSVIEESGPLVYRCGHTIQFNPEQQRRVDGLLSRFAASPYAPPTVKVCQSEVGADIYEALIDLGQLIPVAPDVVFRRQDYDHMIADVHSLLAQNGTITAAQVRDHFNTSRRYALAFLEHLDAIGVTLREGDVRRLK